MPELPITEADPSLGAEVERRVGRNLLLYQRIENGLKQLLPRSTFEGTPEDAAQRFAARAAKVMRMNLGDVAKAVFEQVLINEPKPSPVRGPGSEKVWRTRVTIGSPPDRPDWIDSMRTRCKAIVDARNDLVHHFLRQQRRETAADLQAALDALEVQHAAALELRHEIVAIARGLMDHLRESAAYIASDAGQEALELAISEANVIEVLADVAQSEARADGWTLLDTGQHRLLARVPADAERVRERLGRQWLWQALERSPEIFELEREPLPNGASGTTRAIFRLRLTAADSAAK